MLNLKNKNEMVEQFKFDEVKNRLLLGKQFGFEYLTKRELEILKYILLGSTAKIIARELALSNRTVENYIAIIKLKLRCSSKGKIIRMAVKTGLFRFFY